MRPLWGNIFRGALFRAILSHFKTAIVLDEAPNITETYARVGYFSPNPKPPTLSRRAWRSVQNRMPMMNTKTIPFCTIGIPNAHKTTREPPAPNADDSSGC